jgi:NADPH-dependent curcumin reductase CurA
MTPTTSRHWVLAKKPTDLPIIAGPDATFRLVTKPLAPIEDGQVLIKILYLSNDPAQRLWIDPNITPDRLYIEPVELEDTMASYTCISEVVESKSKDMPVGTIVIADAGWREYAVMPAEACMPIKAIDDLKPVHYVSLFGLAGVTAYYGLVDIAQTGSNDAVVISGAAGAVGSVAVQIAKNVLGCKKVIGIAGTDAKCEWVESLGADICLNYKSTNFGEDLKKATEGFVEVFFDNVGGEVLDLMLKRVKKDGRVAACGAIADYNSNERAGIKNWYQVIAMRLQIRGMVVTDAIPTGRWTGMVDSLIQAYQEGKIRATEEGLTIVPTRFEDVPKTWMGLFEGRNTGKMLTQLV